jgi:chorismate mutase
MGMIDLQERIARERLEIAKRVASFRATQEKFKREREEYCVTTLDNARQENPRHSHERPPFWS